MFRAVRSALRRFGAVHVLAVAAVLAGSGCWAAQASAYVYWANEGDNTIGVASLAGFGVNQRLIANAGPPTALAIAGRYIYWGSDAGTIGRANLNGTGVDESLFSGSGGPQGLAVGATHIYWTDDIVGDFTIERANLEGKEVEPEFIKGAKGPDGVAVDGNYVYWANSAGNSIGRATLEGKEVEQEFIKGADFPHGVAVNSSYIYWANSNGNTIGRASITGGSVDQRFITGANYPTGVAVSLNYIYWANDASNTIGQALLLNGRVLSQSFITGADSPNGVAVTTAVPRWTLKLTAAPASSTGIPVTVDAVTDNILVGTPHYINIYARYTGGKWFPLAKCKASSCVGSLSPPPPYPATAEVEADVGPAHAKPFSPQAIISRKLSVTAHFTRPTCKGNNCM